MTTDPKALAIVFDNVKYCCNCALQILQASTAPNLVMSTIQYKVVRSCNTCACGAAFGSTKNLQAAKKLEELYLAGGSRIKVQPRPSLIWFVEQMELILQKNDHKGGWDGCDADYLLNRLKQEVSELEDVINQNRREPIDLKLIIREAVDVANFAMMIANNVRG